MTLFMESLVYSPKSAIGLFTEYRCDCGLDGNPFLLPLKGYRLLVTVGTRSLR